ncbi:MAG: undecaprenyl/decaprenyl-phosphate alpha-N-acetylglucosaminyl 1-phosphate transferase [Ruminococcaceae bacterium]|nr:undecaprenyl/decaprenyl-phosphate alpha-N-acetylglucosaminyl 1-phosphate transferase [Oscillospiraceae bacterium]
MNENNGIFIIFAFVVALIITYASTPLAQRLSFKLGAVDIPKDNRRMHKEPKALLGGLAIFYGFLVSVLCFGDFLLPFGGLNMNLLGILLGCTIVVILGVFDDIKPRPALFKFIIQVIAAAIPVFLGVRVFTISNPITDTLISLPAWVSIAGSILWIVGVTNAVNLIDGLDGLAAGISSIAAVALLSVLLIEHNGSITLLVMAAALAGSCFGFLPHNFNPAKLFMGDTGATFLGFILACISIQGPFKTYVAFTVPFLVLALPIFDTLFAIIRRLLKGQPIMAPDRGHLHHRLIDRGFSHKTTVIIMYGLSAMLAISAIVMLLTDITRAVILLISVALFGIFAFTLTSRTGAKETDLQTKDAADVPDTSVDEKDTY